RFTWVTISQLRSKPGGTGPKAPGEPAEMEAILRQPYGAAALGFRRTPTACRTVSCRSGRAFVSSRARAQIARASVPTAARGGRVGMRSSFPPSKAGPVTRPSITSTRNPQLKAVRRLRRSRVREREGVFLAEGRRQLESALAAGARVTCVYAAPALCLVDGDEALVREAALRGARIVELGVDAFMSITSPRRPDGVAAVVGRPGTGLESIPAGSLVLVATGIERPGNLGTIVRTAEAAGAGGLVACDATTDVFHPETVRGSVGTVFDLPLAQA